MVRRFSEFYFPERKDMNLQIDRDHKPSSMNKKKTLTKLHHCKNLEFAVRALKENKQITHKTPPCLLSVLFTLASASENLKIS